jgi:transposase-like protein
MVDTSRKLSGLFSNPQTLMSAECPDCGRHSIVETAPGSYRCLGCNFSRDFSSGSILDYHTLPIVTPALGNASIRKSTRKLDGLDWFMAFLVAGLVLFALFR